MSIAQAGSPIRKSTDITDICSSPWLIAACHVLLRLLMPRHSPCALYSLTCGVASCASLARPRQPFGLRRRSCSLRCSAFSSKIFRFLRSWTKAAVYAPLQLRVLEILVLLNYAGNLTGFFEIVIVTHLYDVPQLKLFFRTFTFERPLCCLAYHFHLSLFSFQGTSSDLKPDGNTRSIEYFYPISNVRWWR